MTRFEGSWTQELTCEKSSLFMSTIFSPSLHRHNTHTAPAALGCCSTQSPHHWPCCLPVEIIIHDLVVQPDPLDALGRPQPLVVLGTGTDVLQLHLHQPTSGSLSARQTLAG